MRTLSWLPTRLRPSRVRMRLTMLYGLLFVVSGAVLLGITYLLVSNSPKSSFNVYSIGPAGHPVAGVPPPEAQGLAEQMRAQGDRQHAEELHRLLVQSGIALAIMAILSIALGWLVAGRVLRPLRTMTDSVQQISARNLHERLGASGPRDEMKDLSDTVDGLLGRLEEALDAHKRFIGNAAHELRTPLTLQHALLEETLLDRDASVPSFRATFERLLVLGRQQGRLLESLLTLAGSESGLDRREPVDLAAVTEQVLLASRPALDRAELRLVANVAPARTSGDAALVERLVANLVDNAIGYNIRGGHVEVRVATLAGRAVVTVSNSGSRVPGEQVNRLFEPFQRLDRTAGPEGHHGLGLSIVRAIAAAHDATILAAARPGGGLAVEVGFPVTAAAPEPRALPAAPASTDGLVSGKQT